LDTVRRAQETTKLLSETAPFTAIRAAVQAISAFSDRRLKRDLQNSPLGLVFINALRPVRYRLKNPADYPTALREARFTDGTSPRPVDDTTFYDGLIAQEVKATLDRLGATWSGWSANAVDGKQGIQYGALTVPLVRALQELDDALQDRDAKVAAQQVQIDELLDRLAALERRLVTACVDAAQIITEAAPARRRAWGCVG
jgi:uncharacterized protein YukE